MENIVFNSDGTSTFQQDNETITINYRLEDRYMIQILECIYEREVVDTQEYNVKYHFIDDVTLYLGEELHGSTYYRVK